MLKSERFLNLLIACQARAKLGRKETYHGGDDHDDDGTTTPTPKARPSGNEEERRIRAIVLQELEQMRANRAMESGRRWRKVPKPTVEENPAERLEIQVSSALFQLQNLDSLCESA